MHGEAVLFVHLTALWIDVVVEDHEDVAQLRTSLAQRAHRYQAQPLARQ